MKVYAILAENELLPSYFNTYKKALNEVKKVYPDWDDRYDEDGEKEEYTTNEVEVEEGHKMNKKLKDPNITELYIEKGINISIHKLVVKKTANVSGGYSRRRHSKSNTKSRKHRI